MTYMITQHWHDERGDDAAGVYLCSSCGRDENVATLKRFGAEPGEWCGECVDRCGECGEIEGPPGTVKPGHVCTECRAYRAERLTDTMRKLERAEVRGCIFAKALAEIRAELTTIDTAPCNGWAAYEPADIY